MTDAITEAKMRDREALERVRLLRAYIASRQAANARPAPATQQPAAQQRPLKPRETGGALSTVGRLARIFAVPLKHDEQERNQIWTNLYPDRPNPYR